MQATECTSFVTCCSFTVKQNDKTCSFCVHVPSNKHQENFASSISISIDLHRFSWRLAYRCQLTVKGSELPARLLSCPWAEVCRVELWESNKPAKRGNAVRVKCLIGCAWLTEAIGQSPGIIANINHNRSAGHMCARSSCLCCE